MQATDLAIPAPGTGEKGGGMSIGIRGNGKFLAVWIVVTVVLCLILGAATGALIGGVWPGRVVGITGAVSAVLLVSRLSSRSS
jgi:hypothetical protein